jgi:hypothetical protein
MALLICARARRPILGTKMLIRFLCFSVRDLGSLGAGWWRMDLRSALVFVEKQVDLNPKKSKQIGSFWGCYFLGGMCVHVIRTNFRVTEVNWCSNQQQRVPQKTLAVNSINHTHPFPLFGDHDLISNDHYVSGQWNHPHSLLSQSRALAQNVWHLSAGWAVVALLILACELWCLF